MTDLPRRDPLPEPSLAETADDIAAADPQTVADVFRRENERGIALQPH